MLINRVKHNEWEITVTHALCYCMLIENILCSAPRDMGGMQSCFIFLEPTEDTKSLWLGNSLADLWLVKVAQPGLSDRVVVGIKWRGGELCTLPGAH